LNKEGAFCGCFVMFLLKKALEYGLNLGKIKKYYR